ncbi:EpsG family protein [uncultured Fusobacterium sp.]|uniref:EpsG family protein n=1 Tax=uncultured Fusobacterium sp. TaxID=159267 RepID=UPI002585589A|nr:EpsG family protein [uncultured Fusobacterium sp.]
MKIKLKIDMIGFIMFVMCVLIMGLNSFNLDYPNYVWSYHTSVVDDMEYFYEYLEEIGQFFELNYVQFKFFLSLMGLLLMRMIVKKYTNKTWLFYTLYFLYPFFLDIIENKNFIGTILLTYAISFLSKKEKKNRIIYCFFIILAAGFHNMFILFLPAVFINKINKNKCIRYILKFMVIISIILVFVPGITINIINMLLGSFSSGRTDYFNKVSTNLGFFVMISEQVMAFATSYFEVKTIKKINIRSSINRRRVNLINLVYFFNIYAFVFCPLYRLNGQFMRIMQSMFPIMHISFISTLIVSKNIVCREKTYFKYIYLFYVVFMFLCQIIISHYDDIFITTFTNNWLII